MITNFNSETLLSNSLIKIKFDENIQFNIKLPSVKDITTNRDYLFVLSVLKYGLNFEEQPIVGLTMMPTTIYDTVIYLCSISDKGDDLINFKNIIYEIYDIDTIEQMWFIKNEQKITEEQFNIITDIILIGCGYKDIKTFNKIEVVEEEIEDELTRLAKEAEEKVKKAKMKKKGDQGNNKGITLENILGAIIKEFKIPLKDLFDMNYYTLLWYFDLCKSSDLYDFSRMLAANGANKDYKPFINTFE